jgi:putative transposase
VLTVPRANRLNSDGGIFHVTHRCHNRQFLLKFARDRNAYRARLRHHLARSEVSLLDYCLTSNHVHLLLDAQERTEISELMRLVAGEFARTYNRRKQRLNAFWGDNFHATLIEGGAYLWRCLCYIELNMVRCGVVRHPREWEWVGYHEIVGSRRRYRLLDLERLAWRLSTASLADVAENLNASLEEEIARDQVRREACWTEGLAVGSVGYLEGIRPRIRSRRETELVETTEDVWTLREPVLPYGTEAAGKRPGKERD